MHDSTWFRPVLANGMGMLFIGAAWLVGLLISSVVSIVSLVLASDLRKRKGKVDWVLPLVAFFTGLVPLVITISELEYVVTWGGTQWFWYLVMPVLPLGLSAAAMRRIWKLPCDTK